MGLIIRDKEAEEELTIIDEETIKEIEEKTRREIETLSGVRGFLGLRLMDPVRDEESCETALRVYRASKSRG